MEKEIHSFEAYVSMFEFVIDLYDSSEFATLSKDFLLGNALGNLEISPDTNKPYEAIRVQHWREAIINCLGEAKDSFTITEAFDVMIEFLRKLSEELSSKASENFYQFVLNSRTDPKIMTKWERITQVTIDSYKR